MQQQQQTGVCQQPSLSDELATLDRHTVSPESGCFFLFPNVISPNIACVTFEEVDVDQPWRIIHKEALTKSELWVSCGGQQMDDLHVNLQSVTEEKDCLERELQLSLEKVSSCSSVNDPTVCTGWVKYIKS